MQQKIPLNIKRLFDEFKKLPKGVFVPNPNGLIKAPYQVSIKIKKITGAMGKLYFTRRSLKHLSEKNIEGEKLMLYIPEILKNPTEIRSGDFKNRFLISKYFKDVRRGRPRVVNLEIVEKDKQIIVTSFQSSTKYLSNYELLWRTGGSH